MPTRLVVLALTLVASAAIPTYGQSSYYQKRSSQRNRSQAAPTPPIELPEDKPITGDAGARLQGLIEQRFKMYVEREQAYQKAYNAGYVEQSEAVRATLDALRAEVDQYDKAAKRVPVLQKIVDAMKLQEEIARTKVLQRASNPGKNDTLLKIQDPYWRAKMGRIDAEINLEHERVKAQEEAQATAQPATPTATPAATQPAAK
jgi:hypothetical protein